MIDLSAQKFPRLERKQIAVIGAAVILIAIGWAILRSSRSDSPPAAPATVAAAARAQPTDDLIEATKALGTTQQQAVDQLQAVQDLLVTQRAETKRLSDEIETLNQKLGALQDAVANITSPAAGPSAQKSAPAKNGR